LGLVHKEQLSVEITSREQACMVQMCRKQGFSAQGTVKHGNNQQGASMDTKAGNRGSAHKEQSSMEITSREQACRVQMFRKHGLSAQGTVKRRNNQQGASM
jgi:hypothetical protein